jgi:hypothetical protein
MSGVDYSNPSVHKSDLKLLEQYTDFIGGGGGSIPDPLSINSIDVNLLEVNSSMQGPSGAALTVASDVQIASSKTLSVETITTPGAELYIDNIQNANSGHILHYQVSTGRVTYGSHSTTQSKYLFNRLTAISLGAPASTNTPLQLLFAGGTAGVDYLEVLNQDFSLNTGTNTIVYNGADTKTFYVQASYALLVGNISSAIFGFEIRKNGAGVSQARWGSAAASTNWDVQDFNFISLSQGDNLSFWHAYTASGSTLHSLGATSSSGLLGSTTKPFQLYINEI